MSERCSYDVMRWSAQRALLTYQVNVIIAQLTTSHICIKLLLESLACIPSKYNKSRHVFIFEFWSDVIFS